MDASNRQAHTVGGIELERPFKIRRLGHFGYCCNDMAASLAFYDGLLGFMVSDTLDFGARADSPEQLQGLGDPKGYFMRHGTDHHSFVIFPYRVRKALDVHGAMRENVTTNQITWQVGSLREVVDSWNWLESHGIEQVRAGRDTPGSNWHAYVFDPDGQIIELYYGIEQIGWEGGSKPRKMHGAGITQPPDLPHIPEYAEVETARDKVDLASGYHPQYDLPAQYDVGGVLLPRPFKIVAVGPARLFVKDMAKTLSYYQDIYGFVQTEEVTWNGHTCHFLRVNTEHHSLALYPIEMRAELGLSAHTNCLSFGFRLNDYQQLRDAAEFLGEQGVEIKYLPPELFPGMDYTAFAIDPDGHAVQLYYYMEQLGWEGRPRPQSERRQIDNDNWPQSVAPLSDTFHGEVYLGPWG